MLGKYTFLTSGLAPASFHKETNSFAGSLQSEWFPSDSPAQYDVESVQLLFCPSSFFCQISPVLRSVTVPSPLSLNEGEAFSPGVAEFVLAVAASSEDLPALQPLVNPSAQRQASAKIAQYRPVCHAGWNFNRIIESLFNWEQQQV
jgi:hypothetical protein